MTTRWSQDPVVTVCEATGMKGRSVVNALLETGKYRVRGLVRKTDTPEARELADRGVEVTKCNSKKRKHLEKCFAGSFALFALTSDWEKDPLHADPDLERKKGKLMVDVAQEVGVGHFIWSSAPNVEDISGGAVKVPHFTVKNLVEQHIRWKFEGFTTFVYAGVFCESWKKAEFFKPKKASDGVLEFGSGFKEDTLIPVFDAEDTGYVVTSIVQNRDKFDQKVIYLASELITVPQIAAAYQRVTGTPARYVSVSYEEMANEGYPPEIIEMVKWTNDYGYFGTNRSPSDLLAPTNQHFPRMKTFEEWLRNSGWRADE